MKNSKVLMVSDLHFTDKPKDEYRFSVFPWIKEEARKRNIKSLFILGDITDEKDNHSNRLINRIIDNYADLVENDFSIFTLMGNHDYIDEKVPALRHLNHFMNCAFIHTPRAYKLADKNLLFLPHSKHPLKDWVNLKNITIPPQEADYIFMHQSVSGSLSSSGQEMEGIPAVYFKIQGFNGHVYSGDIHVPQTLGRHITYVGSPYHVHFGDNFTPRGMILDLKTGVTEDIYLTGVPKKVTVVINTPEELESLDLISGDQVKVRVQIKKHDLADWKDYRDKVKTICQKLRLDLHGVELLLVEDEKEEADGKEIFTKEMPDSIEPQVQVDPKQTLKRFSSAEGVDGYIHKVGEGLLNED